MTKHSLRRLVDTVDNAVVALHNLPITPALVLFHEAAAAGRRLQPVGAADDFLNQAFQIAATALVNDLTLVTHNAQDYRYIPGLRLEDWLSS